ncbi:dihydroxyacetone kinase subunit DhaK [Gordonia sp. w5E2]|mgnify:FL=1|uniref:Dihydroxyacetone kinase n=1 Tax=Gordonia jacobaea TaxID=122202 RepID=A0ABR5IBK4_9ACTN|nr:MULTISPECIES: dihydroxyacetone kinase subunit DhaK [Gordonia]SKY01969.1 dihydroxyacetone kinase subunit DhaK [Mycobacteroides abscessus subsp. abscessus]KNA91068.1 dihydroxyacetone kinase [Gordonia jacobaea]OBC05371.1 dihydroxyacetone kinase subunit DhaK [Gordonia sp. 852002-50395_SCH5434458]OBC17640.1 dihydroxyacetone kinase subunit DhaK [Gordonia sp. 852002-50816_SCH5313054-c]OBC18201.1 dihydroxyacetone kinase subunit DhaK [Gordonia sp. 852002-50816_SCH5313054-a]
MKKFINEPADVLADALRGVAAAHPRLRVDHENRVIFRAEGPRRGKVGLVSGGGSGHEPLHGGFVGPGMLDAAACGEVFTSPVPDQILAATSGVDGGVGVLHIVKNYSGDVMNFEMAAELADVEVVSVIVDDDVAVTDSSFTVGRRGVAGTVFVEKIAGAVAERGADLAEVARLARKTDDNARTMGLALTSCTVPAVGHPTFDLPENQIELGVGIHGEPGRKRVELPSANEMAQMLIDPVLADLDFTVGENGVVLLVNGLGGTPLIELYLMCAEFSRLLDAAGITATRTLVGNYVTSLDMAGCSVSLLRLDDELTELWDAPVDTPNLHWA